MVFCLSYCKGILCFLLKIRVLEMKKGRKSKTEKGKEEEERGERRSLPGREEEREERKKGS